MASAASTYGKGTQVWFADSSNSWQPGTVVSITIPEGEAANEDVVLLVALDEAADAEPRKLTFPVSALKAAVDGASGIQPASPVPGQDRIPMLRNPPVLASAEDLSALSNLNEPSVLHAIATRYDQHLPYTYSGIVLVALNPFSPLAIYGNEMIKSYAGKKKGDLEPHLFAIAEEALDCMRRGSGGGGKDPTGAGDQTIVVSGESGAGKTVSAKYILRYFASVEDPNRSEAELARRREAKGEDDGMSETEKQILASNPIMEAFGNAKTTRNDNSSRFGKYIEVLFDPSHDIVGARIRTYLLERSRLVYQPDNERNYHIFYQLLAGAPSKEKKDLSISATPSDFAYLSGGGPASVKIPGVDDAEEFRDTQTALSTVGIAVERQWHIFKILAALLHLGNIKITQARTDAVLADDDAALELATNLLGLPKAEFKKWTIKKQLVTRSEKIVTALGSAQASVVRDSVAKFVYSCLFDWLVGVVNESLCGEDGSGAEKASKFIGVLDIYGFEHFKKNSFEQFCINWANEKLQQEFNAHVFKLEQEEYVREEINWTFIEFADNQACIDVIEGKMGILTLLDEESRLPAGADASLASKLHQQLAKPEHKAVFKKPRFNQNAFTIAHYAHDVTYDIEGFIDKNRDTVPDEHLALLQASSNDFLREVLDASLAAATAGKAAQAPAANGDAKAGPPKRGGTAKKPTLGSIFKGSLISLMDTINNTNVHYIRCIKPNEAKKAWVFEPEQVLSQLRACGVLETIRISCAGYPSRWTFTEFAERYYMLVPSKQWQGNTDFRALCSIILEETLKEADKYQIGLTKIFFRAGMLALLESLRTNRIAHLVTMVQKNVRRALEYRRYQRLRKATIKTQALYRGKIARREYETLRQEAAAVKIQTIARGWLARKEYKRTREAVIRIQAVVRGHMARKKALEDRTNNAVATLQCLFRGHAARLRYKAEIRKVVLIQSKWRGKLAVKELRGLKAEAKSADRFKEISYQLENKVVELTQTVQKRTAENKELHSRISVLESQTLQLRSQHDEALAKAADLELKLAIPSVPLDQFEEAVRAKADSEDKLRASLADVESRDKEIAALAEKIQQHQADLEDRAAAHEIDIAKNLEQTNTVAHLRAELTSLKEQISRGNAMSALTRNQREPQQQQPTSPIMNGLRQFDNHNINGAALPSQRRRQRRHSTGHGTMHARKLSTDEIVAIRKGGMADSHHQPRAVSVMFPADTNALMRPRDSNGLPTLVDSSADEVMRLLEDDQGLDEDVLGGLINDLKIPQPSLHTTPFAKEVLFPAHLISLISNEMWKLGMIPESERFLANVMQTIQTYVMQFKGDAVIQPGIFWLSNVQEILSFICIADADAALGIGPGADEPGSPQLLDWEAYQRLVGIVKHDLDSLEYNIYHTCMLEVKKRLAKMVIPALVESQSLPGFITSDGSGRMFSRMIGAVAGANNQPQFSMDDILDLLNKVWKCLKSYYMEDSVIQQVVTELLKLIGQIAFNDLIMRRNFCSWKRAMQIQYNITRIEEWCKSHEMPEGLLQLEHLMQATKLLQLKKATLGDIEILFDVCWILSPTQIQKLISQYHNADYEAPISSDILKAVAARVKADDKNDQLLLAPETEEVGPYQLPTPRDIPGLETYVPAWLNVPLVRRLATFVA